MPTATKTIEREIRDATEEKKQATEEARQKFLGRLVRAANKLDEKVWDSLSKEAQEWVNDNIELLNNKEKAKDFPDLEDDEEDEEEPAPAAKRKQIKDDEDDEPAPKKKPAAAAEPDDDEDDDDEEPAPVKKKAKAAEPEEDDEPAAKPEKKQGANPRLKELIIKHPSWKKDKLIEKLEEEGFALADNTIGIVYYDMRKTLKVLLEMGVLEDDYAAKVKAAFAPVEEEAPAPKKKPVAKDEDDEDDEPAAKPKKRAQVEEDSVDEDPDEDDDDD